jgi:hypothetical protein
LSLPKHYQIQVLAHLIGFFEPTVDQAGYDLVDLGVATVIVTAQLNSTQVGVTT